MFKEYIYIISYQFSFSFSLFLFSVNNFNTLLLQKKS